MSSNTQKLRVLRARTDHDLLVLIDRELDRGFALVDVFSPCVTYNKDNTYQWFNPRVKILEEQAHDPADFDKAFAKACQWDGEIPIGLIWKRNDLPTLEDLEPVLHTGEGPMALRKLGISQEQAESVVRELL